MYLVGLIDANDIPSSVKDEAEKLLSESEHARYEAFHHQSDALLFLYGRYLARYLVAIMTYRQADEIKIVTENPTTKPYVEGSSHHFSISHSGTFVAVAASAHPIGADIQIHEPVTIPDFHRFFTAKEKTYIGTSLLRFYRLWTAVESLAKITGLGFNESLRQRETRTNETVEGFTYDQKSFNVSIVKETNSLTLTTVTTEPLTFTVAPRNETRQCLPSLGNNVAIYSASGKTDSAV